MITASHTFAESLRNAMQLRRTLVTRHVRRQKVPRDGSGDASQQRMGMLEQELRQLKTRVEQYVEAFMNETQDLRERIAAAIKGADQIPSPDTADVHEPHRRTPAQKREILIEDVNGYEEDVSSNKYKVRFDFSGFRSRDWRVFVVGNKL